MATVILTAVGTYFGGPVGGAIGAAVGQQIDRAIIGPGKAREGPRIKELDIQTSSYGTQIPAIFGAMRVAGTVIWSTDLIEQRTKNGGGKNRPATINYSYSASFAVALSSRPLIRVGRIWADGNLLRGAAGDFKTETDFRFYPGNGDQPLDPLLASAEETGQCPAHRGIAFAVFEDLQLADFGNRIPSLTFEIFERETAVPVLDIAVATSQGAVAGNSNVVLTGFAAQGNECRSALQPLIDALPLTVAPAGDKMILTDWGADNGILVLDDPALADGRNQLDRPRRTRAAHSRAPATVSIRHYDPERDFQAGVQASRRMGNARTEAQVDLAAAVDATNVRGFADLQLLQRWRGLNGFEANVAKSPMAISAGSQIVLDGTEPALRIVEVEHQRGTTRIVANEWVDQSLGIPSGTGNADPGRNLPGQDLIIGQTRIVVAELPSVGPDDPARPIVVVAAAGTGAGWRRAALSLYDGDRLVDLGGSNGIATIGNLVGPLALHTALLEDRTNAPTIRLLHDAMALPVGLGDPFAFDAPAIWLGGEIIRYGNAEKIGLRDYRLQRLMRGCFGTENLSVHADGSDAFLLDADTVLRIDTVPTPISATVKVEALGVGDVLPTEQSIMVAGYAITPRPPVHGAIDRLADNSLSLQWIRRERLSYGWTDGADLPNSENDIAFAIELHVGGLIVATWSIDAPSLQINHNEVLAWSIPAGTELQFRIMQQGRFGRSAPLILATII